MHLTTKYQATRTRMTVYKDVYIFYIARGGYWLQADFILYKYKENYRRKETHYIEYYQYENRGPAVPEPIASHQCRPNMYKIPTVIYIYKLKEHTLKQKLSWTYEYIKLLLLKTLCKALISFLSLLEILYIEVNVLYD